MTRTRWILLLTFCQSAGDLAAQTLLVGNKTDNTVDLVSLASGESHATLPTGVGPHEIAVSPDGSTAVVSNYGRRGEPGGMAYSPRSSLPVP